MEVMKVYNEAMATWIITRVTNGKCEGAQFVFGLIESAIRNEATEILLTPVQELDTVRMDFYRLRCSEGVRRRVRLAHGRSKTSRTFPARASRVNGFCRKATSACTMP